MRDPEPKVALQAIEFWSTVCEAENELALEAEEVSRTYARLDPQFPKGNLFRRHSI